MYIIVPLQITTSMLISGTTIAEPDTSRGEVAWASGVAVTLGSERTYQGSIYTCVLAVASGVTTPPPNLPANWLRKGPTNRMAPFDYYVSTQAIGTTSLTFKVKPGYFNSLAMYGLEGASYTVSVTDLAGNPDTFTRTDSLYENFSGLYELLFSPAKQITKLVFTDIPISPTAEVTITIAAATGNRVAVGMINVGDFRTLFGAGDWGGVEYGAEAEPVSYSYINTAADGTVSIVKRFSSTGLRATVAMPTEYADAAVSAIQEVLDIPVSCVGTNLPGYNGLNVFGLISGSMRYENFSTARLSVNVKGFI